MIIITISVPNKKSPQGGSKFIFNNNSSSLISHIPSLITHHSSLYELRTQKPIPNTSFPYLSRNSNNNPILNKPSAVSVFLPLWALWLAFKTTNTNRHNDSQQTPSIIKIIMNDQRSQQKSPARGS